MDDNATQQEVISPSDASDWPWPQFPEHGVRNYNRRSGEHLRGWEGDFLGTLRNTGIIRAACQAAQISYALPMTRARSDPMFAQAMAEARKMATEVLEAAAWRRAVTGVQKRRNVYHKGKVVGTEVVTEYSDSLLIFLLKANDPEKYRETIDHNYNVNVAIEEARRLAKAHGLNPDEVEAETRRLIDGTGPGGK